MSSSINITFNYADPIGDIFGRVQVFYRNAQGVSRSYTLSLSSQPNIQGSRFQFNDDIGILAANFVFSFQGFALAINGDNNPIAQVFPGGLVKITANEGEFTGVATAGDKIETSFTIENEGNPLEEQFLWRQHPLNIGDCDTVRVQFYFAQGGAAPYRVLDNRDDSAIVSNWNGTTIEEFDFQRNQLHTFRLLDANDELIGEFQSFRGPQNIRTQDFEVIVETFPTSSDIIVNQVVFWPNTYDDQNPITFALSNGDTDLSALEYQVSNVFAGRSPGLYTLHIRDKYGCEVTRQVLVSEFNGTIDEDLDPTEVVFTISEYNSLAFKTCVEWDDQNRRNYGNTLSHQEWVLFPYKADFKFPIGSIITTRFKSSYDVMRITLYKDDGTTEVLPYDLLQQNTAIIEAVNATLFNYTYQDENDNEVSRIGAYFSGGSIFDPVTGDKLRDSPYVAGAIPSWAVVGRRVEVTLPDGTTFGSRQILEVGLFDDERNTPFIVIDGSIGQVEDIPLSLLTIRYNRHSYNVYETSFEMFDGVGQLLFEPGYITPDGAVYDARAKKVSERFSILSDTFNWVRLDWIMEEAVDEMPATKLVPYIGEMWLRGQIRPISQGTAEALAADDKYRSIDQTAPPLRKLFAKILEPKKWRKVELASSLGSRGVFIGEGEELIRINPMTEEWLDNSNESNIEIEFALGGESGRTAVSDPLLVPGDDPSDENLPADFQGYIYLTRYDNPDVLLTDEQGRLLVATRVLI